MTTRTRREPNFITLANGSELVRVPLPGAGRFAQIDRSAFELLLAYGLSDQWLLNGSGRNRYVRATMRCPVTGASRLATVARMVARPGPFQRVRYRNGDRTDLRRWNLEVVSGSGRGREASYLSEIEDTVFGHAGAE